MSQRPAWIVPTISNETLAATEAALRYAIYEAGLDQLAIEKVGKIADSCRLEIHRRDAAQRCDLI